mmetsp:Transcript_6512/g.11310  ORF Transcript_6512/g.11310 Transcript_6512/m.11310 type:complete len:157 (+) Transcript_6512:65-535(+)
MIEVIHASPRGHEVGIGCVVAGLAGMVPASFVLVQVSRLTSFSRLCHLRQWGSLVQVGLLLAVAITFPVSCAMSGYAASIDPWDELRTAGLVEVVGHAPSASRDSGLDATMFPLQAHGALLTLLLAWWLSHQDFSKCTWMGLMAGPEALSARHMAR